MRPQFLAPPPAVQPGRIRLWTFAQPGDDGASRCGRGFPLFGFRLWISRLMARAMQRQIWANQVRCALSFSAKSVFSQENPPSASGARPK